LASLTPRFLERHVQPSQRVKIPLRKRDLLGPAERLLGVEIFHPHELFLAKLAEGLEVICHGAEF
jgi:hypothetical protein